MPANKFSLFNNGFLQLEALFIDHKCYHIIIYNSLGKKIKEFPNKYNYGIYYEILKITDYSVKIKIHNLYGQISEVRFS